MIHRAFRRRDQTAVVPARRGHSRRLVPVATAMAMTTIVIDGRGASGDLR
jgi:hypothetical protein